MGLYYRKCHIGYYGKVSLGHNLTLYRNTLFAYMYLLTLTFNSLEPRWYSKLLTVFDRDLVPVLSTNYFAQCGKNKQCMYIGFWPKTNASDILLEVF